MLVKHIASCISIYLQSFPSNSTRKFKSSPFQHFFAHFGLPWVRPWDNRDKSWMERGFNAGQTHCNIYPSIFNPLQAIARYWSEIATFSYPLAFWGCSHWNSGEKFGPQKTRIMGLPCSEDSLTIGWAVSTQYRRVTYTDGQPISITCAV